MRSTSWRTPRNLCVWAAVFLAVILPLVMTTQSPLLQWRDPIYIAAGFAGVIAMVLLLLQPLLAGRYLPSISARQSRRFHRWLGAGLMGMVVAHVAGLWITSPPDVVDALLFRSPTPFSIWGVVAMWAVLASGLIAHFRHRFRLDLWRLMHTSLAIVIVVSSIGHALLIDGTMETLSKALLSFCVVLATIKAIFGLRSWKILQR